LGTLFDQAIFQELNTYRRLQISMTPIKYGDGYMQVPLAGFSTLYRRTGEIIGHSGSSGSYAFYSPQQDFFIVGDFNQLDRPDLPNRFLMNMVVKRQRFSYRIQRGGHWFSEHLF